MSAWLLILIYFHPHATKEELAQVFGVGSQCTRGWCVGWGKEEGTRLRRPYGGNGKRSRRARRKTKSMMISTTRARSSEDERGRYSYILFGKTSFFNIRQTTTTPWTLPSTVLALLPRLPHQSI